MILPFFLNFFLINFLMGVCDLYRVLIFAVCMAFCLGSCGSDLLYDRLPRDTNTMVAVNDL